ncbi:Per1-like domain protein [Spraguea lophii 42_110]|uniref:Post-GPI attachment to proteins factor 3 n=1 Tax=Spraguea lophii (strain 42_110) TaxID=1358809 RepID=S7WB09_SPRLO|nr:Per1-like domain protein [Spraguea lophii 42_110]
MLKEILSDPKKLSLIKCMLEDTTTIETTFDKIIGRSKLEKTLKQCHINVIKDYGYNNFKVNGRWGFEIMYMCTEIFSVTLSLSCLLIRLLFYFFSTRKHIHKHFMGKLYKIQFILGCIAWSSSAIFHVHETTLYRNMDYFSALLFIIYSFYITVMRVLVEMKINYTTLRKIGIRFFSILFGTYIIFVYHMAFIDFNVYIHKRFCATIIFLTVSSWMYLYLKIRHKKHSKYLLYNTIMMVISIIIENSDIPPFFYIFDSHALWHLMGCIIEYTYYRFFNNDLIYLELNKEK